VETPPRSRDGSEHVTDERFNTVSHLFAACFALVGAALLIAQAGAWADPHHAQPLFCSSAVLAAS